MSNLSELLPTGGGQNAVDFVASGTLSSGQTVALKSDGTVEAVASTGGALSVGTAVVFEAAALATTDASSVAFDSSNNKIVIVYRDEGNSSYGTAIVGTVSGTSISFGTPVVFFTSAVNFGSRALTFDSANNKVVVAFRRNSNLYGYAMVGTVSGTSISFGFSAIFESATTYNIESAFDSNSNKTVIIYRDNGNSDYGTAVVATVSGTSISFGSPVVFNSALSIGQCVFDSSNNKIVIAYYDGGNSGYGTSIVGTVSGTSISFGSATVFKSAASNPISLGFDSTSNKAVIAYKNSSPNTLNSVVGTVSGTSISFGSETSIGSIDSNSVSVTYDSSVDKTVVFYNDNGSSYSGSAVVGTVSGTSISFDTPVAFSGVQTYALSSTFDSNENKVVAIYTDANNSSYGTSAVVTTSGSNFADFIGITADSIADTATGTVNVYGGINEAQTGLTIGSDYYVQVDGSISTTASAVKIGQAISATTINMMDLT